MIKSKFIRIIVSVLIFATVFSSFSYSVLGADSVLTYKVADDGYAMVYDCSVTAKGEIIVPETVEINGETYEVKYIGQKAFDGCNKIQTIIISDGITSIKSRAFRNCTSLTEIYIPESLEVCQYDAFEGCGTVNVYCFKSNYQFFNICGAATDLIITVVDEDPDAEIDDNNGESSLLDETTFFGRLAAAIKNLINNIMEYFNNEDDFTFPDDLPFDLPFEIPEDLISDSPIEF